MAKKKDDDNKSNIRFNALKKIAGLIQSNSDEIYKSTYYTDPENKRQLNDLKSSIDSSIKDILSVRTEDEINDWIENNIEYI